MFEIAVKLSDATLSPSPFSPLPPKPANLCRCLSPVIVLLARPHSRIRLDQDTLRDSMKPSTAVISLVLLSAPLTAAFQQVNATRALQAFPHPAVCDVLQDNVDFPGGDMYSFQAPSATLCCDACAALIQCNAFTWTKYEGGSCYMKLSIPGGKAVLSALLPDGTPYMISAVVYKCQKMLQDTDLVATDLPSVPATSADMCCGICRNTATCDKFSWSNYNGGTCWLKTGSTYSSVYALGVVSGVAY